LTTWSLDPSFGRQYFVSYPAKAIMSRILKRLLKDLQKIKESSFWSHSYFVRQLLSNMTSTLILFSQFQTSVLRRRITKRHVQPLRDFDALILATGEMKKGYVPLYKMLYPS
jgi:hypothetical protein